VTALDDFQARVEGIYVLLDRVAPGWDPERRPDQSVSTDVPVGELARSGIVLSVSYFEGFLKDLVDEAFDVLLASKVSCEKLPSRLKGRALLTHVRRLRESRNPEEIWDAAVLVGSLGQALNSASAVTADLLARDETKRDLTSIDPVNINAVLRAFGDQELNRGPMSIYGQQLRGLKQIRDNAVHGNEQDLPALGFADVATYCRLVLLCAEALYARMTDLVDSVCASP
jgi:RiboL-PSP-HEPN